MFQENFATEDACQQYLAASRWRDGFRVSGQSLLFTQVETQGADLYMIDNLR